MSQDVEISRVLEYQFFGFKLQPARRLVLDGLGKPLELTSSEFELLLILVRRPGRLLSRDQLIELTKRRANDSLDRSIDVLMSRLRKKLGDNEKNQIISTVRNGGYLFCARVETVGVGP
jgi:two-component system OmpR family response regulator